MPDSVGEAFGIILDGTNDSLTNRRIGNRITANIAIDYTVIAIVQERHINVDKATIVTIDNQWACNGRGSTGTLIVVSNGL